MAVVGVAVGAGTASSQSLEDAAKPLVRESCVQCHGVRTVTPLNLVDLGSELTDHETFKTWEKVYDRLQRGEMPPAAARQPEPAVVETALAALKRELTDANRATRAGQRTSLRRLTRLEYGYTIQDLLKVDEAIGAELATLLPAEADSGGFDTVAVNQSMSPLHVQSYLEAADRALDAALVVGPPPPVEHRRIDYAKSPVLFSLLDCDFLACGAIVKLDDAYVTISEIASTFMFHSLSEGVAIPYPGRYRVTVDAYPYQADTPVTLTLYRGSRPGAAASLDELIGAWDLMGDAPRTVEVTPFLRPGDLVSPALADNDFPDFDSPDGYFVPERHARDYKGEGIALKAMTIEGPLLDTWPPPSTRDLLTGVGFDEDGYVQLTKTPREHIADIVERFATRAFRRPLNEADGELEAYVSLAEPLLAEGRPFIDAVRVPLRAILSAPPFLYQASAPGELDDYALATRLSYFLWRSLPDETLFDLASAGRLSDASELARQVDRMLDDPKTQRFVKDFAGQAFRLYELRATSPDPGLYPEYDDRLAQAMERETQLFLAELVAEDHGVGQLIDSDFTFVNRRLAEHYGIAGIEDMQMRKVQLAAESPRGGLLTQAAIHKITANGTTTSPIPRGNFVLSNLLGRPAPPPPPGVGTVEPDTRGTTTIREQLDAHRSSPVCANCHRTIDPPGFALEAFDPIGGFRTNYRVSGGMMTFGDFTLPAPYTQGAPVDATGVTPGGDAFSDIEEYKALLLNREIEQVARHLTSQLIVYATGAEIEFADRDSVERVLATLSDRDYPIRAMIQEVVKSDLFRSN